MRTRSSALPLTGEEGVGQPREAQLLRPPLHELDAHRLGGDSVGRGDGERGPGQGALLAGERPSRRHDPLHGRQVIKVTIKQINRVEFFLVEKGI